MLSYYYDASLLTHRHTDSLGAARAAQQGAQLQEALPQCLHHQAPNTEATPEPQGSSQG